jgi:hypothetical protein
MAWFLRGRPARRLARLAVPAVAAVIAVLGSTGIADAAPATQVTALKANCPANNLCLFWDANYRDPLDNIPNWRPGKCFSYTLNWHNDEASSSSTTTATR